MTPTSILPGPTRRGSFDPDYASKTGRSVRTIGYSPTAGFIITVITVVEEGRLWGVNAWKANEKDAAAYEGRQ